MATKKRAVKPKAPPPPPAQPNIATMTTTEQREEWNRSSDMAKQLTKMSTDAKLRVMIGAGVGSEFFTCYMCGGLKPRSQFFTSTDLRVRSGVSRICRACYEELCQDVSKETTDEVDANRQALKVALEYVDQPFFENLYQSAVREAKTPRARAPIKYYMAYKRSISNAVYRNMRYRDGEADVIDRNIAAIEDGNKEMTVEEYKEFEKNKADALRVAGYYPFENEALSEQPFLYAEFSGYVDAQKDDYPPFWISSVVQIIKNNAMIERLNQLKMELSKDPQVMSGNLGALKEASATQAQLTTNNIRLAKENCISLRNNKTASRGEDSWTGRMKQLQDYKLRDYDVNKFDIDTCAGMQQVADISAASIFKELTLDENDYTEIVKEQRERMAKLEHEMLVAKERARLLLKENLDLKQFMDERQVDYHAHLQNNELFEQGFFTVSAESVHLDGEDTDDVYEVEFSETEATPTLADEAGDADA